MFFKTFRWEQAISKSDLSFTPNQQSSKLIATSTGSAIQFRYKESSACCWLDHFSFVPKTSNLNHCYYAVSLLLVLACQPIMQKVRLRTRLSAIRINFYSSKKYLVQRNKKVPRNWLSFTILVHYQYLL